MKTASRLLLIATAASFATACATNPETGRQEVSRAGKGAAAGAVGGALVGALLGGRRNRTETIVGAGIGALAGAGVGAYMDKQERDLRERTAGSGIDIERRGDEINLRLQSGITFDFNSSAVKSEFRPTLNRVAGTLASYQSTFVDISGHTDAIGTDAVNQRLSDERARAVADYLSYQGVNRARLATQGFGKRQPIASNDTEAGRGENRRVEIRISPVTQQDYDAVRRPG